MSDKDPKSNVRGDHNLQRPVTPTHQRDNLQGKKNQVQPPKPAPMPGKPKAR